MYYIPTYFRAEEWFSKSVIQQHTIVGTGFDRVVSNKIWRLIDNRTLWTADQIREYFARSVIINDWLWAGRNQQRGFRSIPELFNRAKFRSTNEFKLKLSSYTSQHCMGRASDSKIKGIHASEIRADIRKNPNADRYKYITCVEDGVSWLHFDTRAWNKSKYGILFFKP
jgi:hypothetical protein